MSECIEADLYITCDGEEVLAPPHPYDGNACHMTTDTYELQNVVVADACNVHPGLWSAQLQRLRADLRHDSAAAGWTAYEQHGRAIHLCPVCSEVFEGLDAGVRLALLVAWCEREGAR